jgi:hypothetical protein
MKHNKFMVTGMLALLLAFGMTVSLHAQSGLFFGGELGLSGILNLPDDLLRDTMRNVSPKPSSFSKPGPLVAFALGGHAGYGISDKFAVMGGLALSFNQGVTEHKMKFSTGILDIPVTVRYIFFERPFAFGFQIGPYVGIPFGAKLSGNGSVDYNAEGAVVGLAGGFFGGFPAGPGRITAGIRFLKDFNAVKTQAVGPTLWRTNLMFMAGYELTPGAR